MTLRYKSFTDEAALLHHFWSGMDGKFQSVVTFNGRVLVLRWMDSEVASRYGTGVYVRCGARA